MKRELVSISKLKTLVDASSTCYVVDQEASLVKMNWKILVWFEEPIMWITLPMESILFDKYSPYY